MTSMEPELGPTATDLAKLVGIIESPPRGMVATQGDWVVVGVLAVHGDLVEAVPRRGILDRQHDILMMFAIRVWTSGRNVLPGWTHDPEVGWMTKVRVRRGYDDGFPLSRLNSLTSSSVSGAVLAMAGLNAPSGM